MERFAACGEAAVGADKTIINLFNPAATPTARGRIFKIFLGCGAAPADTAGEFLFGRTTAVGTEGTGFVPNNLDPAGPAGAYDSGYAHSAEPTYTSVKQLLEFGMHQKNLFKFEADIGEEIILAATQNNGGGLRSRSHSGVPVHQATIWFME